MIFLKRYFGFPGFLEMKSAYFSKGNNFFSETDSNGFIMVDNVYSYFFRNGVKTPSKQNPDKIVAYISFENLPGFVSGKVEPRKWKQKAEEFFKSKGLIIFQDFLPDIDFFPDEIPQDSSIKMNEPPKLISIQHRSVSSYFNAFILQKEDGGDFDPDHDELLARMRQSAPVQVAGPCFLVKGKENEPHTYNGELEIRFSEAVDRITIDRFLEQNHFKTTHITFISNRWYVGAVAPEGMGAGLNRFMNLPGEMPEVETVRIQNYFPTQ